MSCIFAYIYGNPITEKQTATSYSMVWKETSKNGGTVNGTWGGPMIDGKRDGLWKADVKFNLFGDAPEFRTGTITMTRSYKNGIPDGPYKYNYNVNYREGFYNSKLNKWIYSEPEGDTETVSGAFVDGRPDGHWSIKSTMRGGFESEMNFDNGIPKGEIRSYEYFWGPRVDVFDEKGFLIQHEENGNHGINGWKYSNPDSIPLDVRVGIPASRYFTSDGVDDNYYAKGCEMFKWIQIYPYMSSEDTPILEGKEVHHKNYDEREDIEFKEFYGGDYNWIELMNKKKNELGKHLLSERDRKKAEEVQSLWEQEILNLKKNGYIDFEERTYSSLPELELLINILKNDTEINEIITDPNYADISYPKLKEYFDKIDKETSKEKLKYQEFLQKGRESAYDIIGSISKNLPTEIIDSLFDSRIEYKCIYVYSKNNGEITLMDMNAFEREMAKKRFFIEGKRYIDINAWTSNVHNFYQDNFIPINKTEEISDEDLFLYFITNEMIIESSGYKISQSKNKEKDPNKIISKINKVRGVIPRDIDLSIIKYSYAPISHPHDLEYTYDVSFIKNNIEKNGLWEKLLKNYNKILKRK